MTKIDRAVQALREAAAALDELPETDTLRSRGLLEILVAPTPSTLRAEATRLEEIQTVARAIAEEPDS